MKLIFHGGLNKSGSTSIQSILQKNKKALKELGYLIPETGIKFKSRHHLYLSYKGDEYMNLIDTLYKELLESGCHTVIMSEESLNKERSSFIPKHKYLKKYFESIQFVFFLRRQDTLLESHYNQSIKAPWQKNRSTALTSSLLDYAKSLNWLHYDKFLDDFEAVVGQKNIVVVPFEKAQVPRNIGRFFLEDICQLDTSTLNVKERFDNTSLPYSSLGMARAINAINISILGKATDVRRELHKHLREYFNLNTSVNF
jgi:HrpA-like RNA helicase